MNSYRDLIAWQKAMDVVVEVYQATDSFLKSEQFGLTNQLRRAAVSIPSNIAEGQGRGSPDDFARFLRIARGSLQEVETQLILSQRLGYLQSDQSHAVLSRLDEVSRIIAGLIRSKTS
jgi:four helix bundle protein